MVDVEPGGGERPAVFLVREERRLVPLRECLDARRGTDEVLELHDGKTALATGDRHPRDLQVGLVHGEQVRPVRHPFLRGEPGLDDEQAVRFQMGGHRRDRAVESIDRADVADRAEQACDDIESPPERKVRHVIAVQVDARQPLASDREELRVEIDPADLVPGPQLLEVLPRATGNVEQRRCTGDALLDQRPQAIRLGRVVLERVHGVIDRSRLPEHQPSAAGPVMPGIVKTMK